MADDKFDEKEMEKHDEKSAEEKSWDEKQRRDPLSGVVWAFILIWAGGVLLAFNSGWLDGLITRSSDAPGWMGDLLAGATVWSFILLGAGVIVMLEVVVRLLVPAYRRPVTGTFILAVILIGIGLGDLISWGLVWALILIFLGVSLLLRGLTRS